MMKKFLWIFLLGLLSIAAFGCATTTTYQVQVNGYTDNAALAPFFPSASFSVIENKEAQNPLLEKEVKAKIDKLLEKHGYPLVPYDQAEYYMFFTYGMGAPQTVAVTTPSWGFGLGFGTGYWGPGAAYGLYWPGYGPYYTETQALYNRWLRLTVVEGRYYRETGKSHTIWVGEARSTGTSSDLREVLNPLLIAAFEQFGKNTSKAVPTQIKQKDPRVENLERVR
jgi:hypothetical protein